MSSFITRFLASMSMKESKPTQAAETRPRRHERSSRHHHRPSRRDHYRSSYYDSDETEVETDDEPPANSLMLDLGPDYSPKTMSTISFPSPPTRGATLLFETDDMDNSPQHLETRQPSAAAQSHRKPVQYDTSAAQTEAAFRKQRGRSSSNSSGSQQHERRASRTSAYISGTQWVW
ncbi:hypothetical protein B0J17DRAFT_632607 [Rhizoctonia solani]|nr:hypothetical protein B0J17DRAFT_632607 [Rhizoctonia solani]